MPKKKFLKFLLKKQKKSHLQFNSLNSNVHCVTWLQDDTRIYSYATYATVVSLKKKTVWSNINT